MTSVYLQCGLGWCTDSITCHDCGSCSRHCDCRKAQEGKMEEFAKAMEAFLALPLEEQRQRLEEAASQAKRISDDFDRKLRIIDPIWLFQPMTI